MHRDEKMEEATAMLKRFIALAAAGIAVLALAPGMASAHLVRWESKLRITGYIDNASFLGNVRSERRGCRRNRVVSVWKRNPGAMDGPVGVARTDRRGIWAVFAPAAAPSVYYAFVRKRVRKRRGHRHVCRGDRSPSLRL